MSGAAEWSAAAEAVTPDAAADITRRSFGIAARATALASERDHNFAIETEAGERWVLKLTHPAERREFTLWQTEALTQAARRSPGLPLPRLGPATDGRPWAEVVATPGAAPRIARLMTLLPGVPLHRAPPHPRQRAAIGAALACLHGSLAELDTAPAPSDLLWDLRRAPKLRVYLPNLADAALRSQVAATFDRLERDTLPALARLPVQAIHNDFQPWNLLVDAADAGRISGIIDFGDMVAAPPVMDLAVACAYHVGDIEAVIAGYESLRPLSAAEQALVMPLVAGRLAMTLAITAWRAGLHPENATYILRNAAAARTGLEQILAAGQI